MDNKYWMHTETREDAEAIRKGCTMDVDVSRWEIVAAKNGGFYLAAVDATGRFFPGDPDHPFLTFKMTCIKPEGTLEFEMHGPEVMYAFDLLKECTERFVGELEKRQMEKISILTSGLAN